MFDYYTVGFSNSDWALCGACFDLTNGETLQAGDTGIGFCSIENTPEQYTFLEDDEPDHNYDRVGVVKATSTSSYTYARPDED